MFVWKQHATFRSSSLQSWESFQQRSTAQCWMKSTRRYLDSCPVQNCMRKRVESLLLVSDCCWTNTSSYEPISGYVHFGELCLHPPAGQPTSECGKGHLFCILGSSTGGGVKGKGCTVHSWMFESEGTQYTCSGVAGGNSLPVMWHLLPDSWSRTVYIGQCTEFPLIGPPDMWGPL